jgi:hypothetical protein
MQPLTIAALAGLTPADVAQDPSWVKGNHDPTL